MILEVYELSSNSNGDGSLVQKMTVGDSTPNVFAIRPHLYIEGNPAGSLYMEILNDGGGVPTSVLATSETLAISAITTAAYFHGYVRFYINAILAADSPYHIAIRSTGYTFADSSFVGGCSDYDLRKYPVEAGVTENPLDLEVWGYQLVTKGTYP